MNKAKAKDKIYMGCRCYERLIAANKNFSFFFLFHFRGPPQTWVYIRNGWGRSRKRWRKEGKAGNRGFEYLRPTPIFNRNAAKLFRTKVRQSEKIVHGQPWLCVYTICMYIQCGQTGSQEDRQRERFCRGVQMTFRNIKAWHQCVRRWRWTNQGGLWWLRGFMVGSLQFTEID